MGNCPNYLQAPYITDISLLQDIAMTPECFAHILQFKMAQTCLI